VISAKLVTPIFTDSATQPGGADSQIYVIFTDPARTKAALHVAVRLARGLDLTLELLTAQVVPYPLPLDDPPVSIDFTKSAMSRLVADLEADILVRILLCRDADEALRSAVGRDAVVIIGGARPKLTRLLQSDGRRLVIIF
jgi:hypothetical protein